MERGLVGASCENKSARQRDKKVETNYELSLSCLFCLFPGAFIFAELPVKFCQLSIHEQCEEA